QEKASYLFIHSFIHLFIHLFRKRERLKKKKAAIEEKVFFFFLNFLFQKKKKKKFDLQTGQQRSKAGSHAKPKHVVDGRSLENKELQKQVSFVIHLYASCLLCMRSHLVCVLSKGSFDLSTQNGEKYLNLKSCKLESELMEQKQLNSELCLQIHEFRTNKGTSSEEEEEEEDEKENQKDPKSR
ncbi:hypothetical protein RFI_37652, partial [Reticulomyxa filosa]